MKLICEQLEDVEFICEDSKTGKNYYIEGVFMQANVKNRNGRVYPKEILQKETKRYEQNYIKQNRAFGELGHPDGPTVNLERVSHMIQELKEDGDNYVGRAKIMDTSAPAAFVNGIMEGKEWIWDNGILDERHVARIEKEIKITNQKQLDEIQVKLFDKFMSSL